MKKTSKKYLGFTLVELIIVITILAILATIAFVSFQNYTSQTRDTKRVSDLTQISKGLDIFQVTSGTLPTPDSPKTLTGGNSTLFVGKINSKVLSNLAGEVFDPSTKTEYTYATIGNGKYYQIGADSENLVTSVFTNTYADARSSIVKGNYLFDPSLPSLIISSGSSLYDPNNCFVINGGTNLVSNNTNCTPKSSTSLKNFDNSLVGYWDMETTSGGLLKDLTGNGNDGIGSGGTIISTGTFFGKGYYFATNTGGTTFPTPTPYLSINNSNSLNNLSDDFTFNILISIPIDSKTRVGRLFTKGSNVTSTGIYYGLWQGKNSSTIADYNINTLRFVFNTGNGMITIPFNTTLNLGNYNLVTITYIKSQNLLKFYINGNLDKSINVDLGVSMSNTNDISIGWDVFRQNWGLNGYIDDFKIYNRALSDEEILGQAKLAGF